MSFYFDVYPLPLVDDNPDVPDSYFVCLYSGDVIACFNNYDDAVDLICFIEEFCTSRGLSRKSH